MIAEYPPGPIHHEPRCDRCDQLADVLYPVNEYGLDAQQKLTFLFCGTCRSRTAALGGFAWAHEARA